MKKTLAMILGGSALAAAFWLGRATDNVSAEPQPTATPTERSEQRAALPRVQPQPTLPHRSPARGLASDLVAADPKIRRAAVAEAARGDADPQVMLAASRDVDMDVARIAIASLNQLYVDGKLDPKEMIGLAGDRTIPDRTRLLAINGVGMVPSPEGAAMFTKMLAGGSTLERRAASASLGGQDPELAVPALIAALSDADEYVRLQAVDSLKLLSRGRDFGLDAGAWQSWWQARR